LSGIKSARAQVPRLVIVITARPGQRRLCSWIVVALLFMQLAVAAYACPRGVPSGEAVTPMPAMPDCAGGSMAAIDPDQPLLCKAHCDQGTQAVIAVPVADAPSAPVLVAILDWSYGATLERAPPARRHDRLCAGAPPPGSPPLYLSLLVLRN
jgi:hypothetical protein